MFTSVRFPPNIKKLGSTITLLFVVFEAQLIYQTSFVYINLMEYENEDILKLRETRKQAVIMPQQITLPFI